MMEYNRNDAVAYAQKWALARNPEFYNFDALGGDCTSFISQCIFAGSKVMNEKHTGWYYRNGYDKSPSWTGVEFLRNFLVSNQEKGPFGKEVNRQEIKKGDIAQLSFDGYRFAHSLLIVNILENSYDLDHILIAAHTDDSWNRRISSYQFQKIRFIQIQGIREK